MIMDVKLRLLFCFNSAQAFSGTSKSRNSLENGGVCKKAADTITSTKYNKCPSIVANTLTLSPELQKKKKSTQLHLSIILQKGFHIIMNSITVYI